MRDITEEMWAVLSDDYQLREEFKSIFTVAEVPVTDVFPVYHESKRVLGFWLDVDRFSAQQFRGLVFALTKRFRMQSGIVMQRLDDNGMFIPLDDVDGLANRPPAWAAWQDEENDDA